VKAIMAGMGYAVMGTATAKGDARAIEAAQRAIASPLLEAGAIDGARGILINITGSSSLKLAEVNEASSIIQNAAHEDANIIFGAVLDEKMKDDVKITVIATGFRTEWMRKRDPRVANAAVAISQSRTSYSHTPAHVEELQPEPEPEPIPESAPIAQPIPVTVREPRNLEEVAAAVKGAFEQEDLDIPAFLRKRGETA